MITSKIQLFIQRQKTKNSQRKNFKNILNQKINYKY
jgi:hypothetical protein